MSSSTSAPTAKQSVAERSGSKRSVWIISPVWDLLFLVATPLAIVPIVTVLAWRYFTPEQISLVVISFASLGHHLPGFMRTYGDAELFRRFRWRFLLVPPIVMATSLFFAWRGLHGLSLVLLCWSTWHGLMQTYGFMRIYDLKRGVADKWSAGLDFALCLMMFLAGMVFSDARVFGVSEALWQSGVPPLSVGWLIATRWLVGVSTAVVLVAYAVEMLRASRKRGVTWNKVVLAVTTGWLYWMSGSISTNILVGVAMFEVFHAVQYYAIVWIYNRKLADRVGPRFGPLGFLFQHRWTFLLLYLAAIVAFGGIRFWGAEIQQPVFQTILLAILTTSTLLHFYYDGFIWKVRESETSANLDIDPSLSKWQRLRVPAVRHLAKWSLLYAVLGGLMLLELGANPIEDLWAGDQRGGDGVTGNEFAGAEPAGSSQARFQLLPTQFWQIQPAADRLPELRRRQERQLAALAAWTPQLPEVKLRLSADALQRDDTRQAIELARQAVAARPRSHLAHAALGKALLASGQYSEAVEQLSEAVALRPREWQSVRDLAIGMQQMQRWDEAEHYLEQAQRLRPDLPELQWDMGVLMQARGDHQQAAEQFQRILEDAPRSQTVRAAAVESLTALRQHKRAVELAREGARLRPDAPRAQVTLGKALIAAGQFAEARDVLRRATQLDADHTEARFQLAVAQIQLGEHRAAADALNRVLRVQPDHALAHFQLGNVSYLERDFSAAVRHYRRCSELSPDFPEAFNNLGAALYCENRVDEAVEAYEAALRLRPAQGQWHYDLGLLLRERGAIEASRRHALRAQELGVVGADELLRQLQAP